MASYNQHNPHEHAGLEVVPEPEAPQVVEGPHWDKPTDAPYGAAQQPNSAHPVADYNAQQQGYFPPAQQHPYYSPSHVGTGFGNEKSADPRILNLPRRKFLILFGALAALLVIALAVGLGVGLGTRKTSSSDSSATASATPSESAAPSPIACPQANNTVYTTSADVKYNITCKIDYNSGGGTTDLGNVDTDTMEDCINSCAALSACVGAGYGDDGAGKNTCWMKSHLGTSQVATDAWLFAIKES